LTAFVGNPTSAVNEWLNTVFHRVPMLHPNMAVFGYAKATGVDVADYGSGTADQPDEVIVWPPPGATNVPATFNTGQEGPNPPPAPGNMATTGPIISVFFANNAGTITSHSISVGGVVQQDTALTPSDPTFGAFLMGSYCFYTDPQGAAKKFDVTVTGTVSGHAFTKSWSFTTQ
jgi:hypothetical protein